MIDSAFLKDINLFQDIIWNILELKRFVLFYFDLSKSYFGIKKIEELFLAGYQVFRKKSLYFLCSVPSASTIDSDGSNTQKRTKSCDFWFVCNLVVNESFIRNAMSPISLRLTTVQHMSNHLPRQNRFMRYHWSHPMVDVYQTS